MTSLTRTVVIKAEPTTVFRYFTDSARWANWWGAGSTIEARPGGKVYIRHANGVEATGAVKSIEPPRKIAFTLGYVSGKPMPPGSSVVTIGLSAVPEGTRLELAHEFEDAEARDMHVQGWRFQLSMFSNVVANEVFADSAARIDTWFDAWTIPDEGQRATRFAAIASPAIQVRDRHSLLIGLEDLNAHAGAALRYRPGVFQKRQGDVRQCQGTALAEWVVPGDKISGTDVFTFGPDGRIESVTGLIHPS